jgi:hypothetical protein
MVDLLAEREYFLYHYLKYLQYDYDGKDPEAELSSREG